MTPKRTPLAYYGGKSKMMKNLLPLFPKHRIFCSAYAGGLAEFFMKGKSELEVINDIDGNVINFWQIMKTNFDALLHEIEMSLFDENLFHLASNIYKSPKGYSKVKRAWAFWFLSNFSFSNRIGGGFKFCNATDGSHYGKVFNKKKLQFDLYRDRLKEVQISCRSALKVINSRDFFDTFFFLDPPYPRANQGQYAKTKFTIDRLIELMEKLETIEGKFMLCNYWQPEMQLFLARNPNWNIESFGMRLAAARTSNKRKIEIIITNYEITQTLF